MAYLYNRSHSRNSSTGLGSSISCLDGVPFKVGPKFKPPPRVFLPPDLNDAARRSQVLNEEYVFETEEAVLRWAQAREEAKVEQERIKAEKVASAIEDLSKPQNGDGSDGSSGDERETANVPLQAGVLLPQQTPQPTPRLAFANMSNDILTPVPIAPAKAVEETKPDVPQTVNFDLALFEREDDPFENVERQLINEMEELKSVLDPLKSSTNTPPENSSNSCDTNITNNTSNSPAFNNPASNQTVQNFPSSQQQGSTELSGPRVPVFVPRNQPYEEGDYVELRLEQGNSVVYKAGDTHDFLTGDKGSRRVDPSASNIYKSVLPPIGPPSSKGGPLSTAGSEGLQQTTASEPSSYEPDANRGLTNGVSRNSSPNYYSPVEFTQKSDAILRNARSNPELSCSETAINSKVFPLSHSPPPRPSSGQLWNPYKPLPPTPDIMSSSDQNLQSQGSSCSDLVSPSEFDPYSSLSLEAQKFVNNLVSMGFSRPQVARAVHQHGTDEKEVVEYLCHVAKLTEKGFNPIHAETALRLFDNNAPKAEQYLEMFVQFRELGFGEEKIKEALVKENMDRDKALDFLTA